MTEVQPGQCACGAEWATVRLSSDKGSVLVGSRCAAVLENVMRLQGTMTRRAPALSLMRGSAQ